MFPLIHLLSSPSTGSPNQDQRHDAPESSTLQAFSKRPAGKILGSYTAKVASGFLIGLGLAFSFTGFGLALVGVGVIFWLLSTAISTAGLEEKDMWSVSVHIGVSLIICITGIYLGVLNFGSGAACLASASPSLFSAGQSIQMGSVAAPLRDIASALPEWETNHTLRSITLHLDPAPATGPQAVNPGDDAGPIRPPAQNPAFQIVQIDAKTTPEVIRQTKNRILATFSGNRTVAKVTTNSGTTVFIHLDNGRDCISFETVAQTVPKVFESRAVCVAKARKEWIAVPRCFTPEIRYDLMLKSSFDRLPVDEHGMRLHPTSQLPLATEMTIGGSELNDLLNRVVA